MDWKYRTVDRELSFAFACTSIVIVLFIILPIGLTYASDKREQPYVVRYGTVNWNQEKMELLTEDGVWTLEDPPEYENDTKVRILFDSKGTKKATDDVVIDLIEMEE